MSEQITLGLDSQTIKETSMVDLAFILLKKTNQPFYYRDIMKEVAKLKGLTEGEITNVIAQLYTEINIDGRFACVGHNLWGLKRWYPTEKPDDNPNAPRSRLLDDDDLDDETFDEEDLFGTVKYGESDDDDFKEADTEDDSDIDYAESDEDEDENSEVLDDNDESADAESDDELEDTDDADVSDDDEDR
jgi:DNA-directed RNA polymerase subunit delta